ncbi:hypothetical protein RSSM_01197 [Rhodopirellula sallentina SM41]|uniref:Uncharacterized protein n=1 Tax=Rhodopirellula sallentina SM41 TaxID=1263870 RepID=M5UHP0_9BACT|nr:hypothetical protein RSSM_01197 [Rhodopirellula sallentina SM41]
MRIWNIRSLLRTGVFWDQSWGLICGQKRSVEKIVLNFDRILAAC